MCKTGGHDQTKNKDDYSILGFTRFCLFKGQRYIIASLKFTPGCILIKMKPTTTNVLCKATGDK